MPDMISLPMLMDPKPRSSRRKTEDLRRADILKRYKPRECATTHEENNDEASDDILHEVRVLGFVLRHWGPSGKHINHAQCKERDCGGGKRAIAVRVSAQNTAGGFILPNDRVDVVQTVVQQATPESASVNVNWPSRSVSSYGYVVPRRRAESTFCR